MSRAWECFPHSGSRWLFRLYWTARNSIPTRRELPPANSLRELTLKVVAHDRNPYGESVRTRTGQTQLMTECLERLDAIADAAEDKANSDEAE